jgi:hypothetical protein
VSVPTGDAFLRRCEGSILLEVMVAIALLAILIVPLAGGILSAVGRADTVRRQAARVVDAFPGEAALPAWSWGGKVASASWRPGPTLYIRTEPSGDKVSTVGLWVDGWFLGEENPDGEGVLRLEAPTWSTHAGSELVMRMRTPGGAWGPPWRSLVPGVEGVVSLAASAGVTVGTEGQVVAHSPAAANPEFQLSWDQICPQPGPLGLPLALQTALSGPSGMSLDGSGQSWWMNPDRDLDVYF